MREIAERVLAQAAANRAYAEQQYGPQAGEPDVVALARYALEAEKAQERVLRLVEDQAEDEGLWFVADSIVEAYLQQELRRLHAAIEGAFLVHEPVAQPTDARHHAEIAAGLRVRAEVAEARVEALTQVAEAARDDLRGVMADIMAIKGHLDDPYPDDPRWTPWTRFAERALRAIENTRGSLALDGLVGLHEQETSGRQGKLGRDAPQEAPARVPRRQDRP